MQAPIVAALITLGTNIAPTLFQKWSNAPKTPAEVQGEEFVKQKYDDFRTLLENRSVRILVKLEDGQNRNLRQIRQLVLPDHAFRSREEEDQFDDEFAFRLKYLESTGMLTNPGGEYFITNAGMAFLAEARKRKDYYAEFFLMGREDRPKTDQSISIAPKIERSDAVHIKCSVLFADDEPWYLECFGEELRQDGWNVIYASDAKSAVEMANIHQIDVIVIDICLPPLPLSEILLMSTKMLHKILRREVLGGIELYKIIHKKHPTVKIVICSTLAEDEIVRCDPSVQFNCPFFQKGNSDTLSLYRTIRNLAIVADSQKK